MNENNKNDLNSKDTKKKDKGESKKKKPILRPIVLREGEVPSKKIFKVVEEE